MTLEKRIFYKNVTDSGSAINQLIRICNLKNVLAIYQLTKGVAKWFGKDGSSATKAISLDCEMGMRSRNELRCNVNAMFIR